MSFRDNWVGGSGSGGGAPSGPAGGDLGGTYPDPTVPGLAAEITIDASATQMPSLLIYDNWTDAHAKALTITSLGGTVEINLESNVSVGPGSYDMSGIFIRGTTQNLRALDMADGAVFVDATLFDNVSINSLSVSGPVLTFTGSAPILRLNRSQLQPAATSPVIDITAGDPFTQLIIISDFSTAFIAGGGGACVQVSLGKNVVVFAFNRTSINDGAFGGPGDFAVSRDACSFFDSTQHPLVTGGIIDNLCDLAEAVSYPPGVPADWPSLPSTVAQALDAIAAGDFTQESGVFVVDPNASVDTQAQVYDTFEAAHAAALILVGRGVDVQIIFEDDYTLSTVAVYDCRRMAFVGTLERGNSTPTLTLADGVQLRDLTCVTRNLEIVGNNSALPVFTHLFPSGGPVPLLKVQLGSIIRNEGTVPMFQVDSAVDGYTSKLVVLETGSITFGSAAVLSIAAGDQLNIISIDLSSVSNNAVTGAGTLFVQSSPDGSQPFNATHVGLTTAPTFAPQRFRPSAFSRGATNGATAVAAPGSTIVNLDVTEPNSSPMFTLLGTGEMRADVNGNFRISVDLTLQHAAGNSRTDVQMFVAINGIEVAGTRRRFYCRSVGYGDSASISDKRITVSAGDFVSVRIQRTLGVGNCFVLANGALVTIDPSQ